MQLLFKTLYCYAWVRLIHGWPYSTHYHFIRHSQVRAVNKKLRRHQLTVECFSFSFEYSPRGVCEFIIFKRVGLIEGNGLTTSVFYLHYFTEISISITAALNLEITQCPTLDYVGRVSCAITFLIASFLFLTTNR